MNTVTINGVTFSSVGSISINRNRVVIDGKDITPNAKEISISVQGNVEKISADNVDTITVSGNADHISTMSGDVEVGGNVSGSISTMSGDVDVDGSVGGGISSMSGSVRHR